MRQKFTALLLAVLIGTVFFLPGLRAGRVHVLSTAQPAQAAATSDYRALEWYLDAIGAPAAWAQGATGKGVTICSVDTGVSATPDLASQIVGGEDVISIPATSAYDDLAGHGSGVSSEMVGNGTHILGAAPGAKLYVVRALTADGGEDFNVAAGIYACVAAGSSVINMSLGGDGDGYTGLAQAVRFACARGLSLAVAEGNSSEQDRQDQPANINSPCLLAVEAANKKGRIAAFSNYGENARQVLAPGTNLVLDTMYGGVTSMSGTSMATPLVSASLALLMGLGADAPTAVALLRATARIPSTAPRDTWSIYGSGDIHVDRAVRLWATA